MEWIGVEDKLPENEQYVLCWYEYYRYGDYNCMFQTYGIGYCINGYWGGEVSNGSQTKVLYWMSLPESPEILNADHRKQRGRTAPNEEE